MARQPPVPAGPSRGSRDPRGRGKGREKQGGTWAGGLGGAAELSRGFCVGNLRTRGSPGRGLHPGAVTHRGPRKFTAPLPSAINNPRTRDGAYK